jgi:DNA-directed RNA polymerase subunit RPC12/RpoP
LSGELDLILRPIYGFSDTQLDDQEKYAEEMRNNLFAVDFNHKNMIVKSEEKDKQQPKEVESEVQIFDDYNIDDLEEADVKSKPKSKRAKPKKSKYGYKYDDFIDDSDDFDSDDDDWEEPEPKPKKKRGRPKKIKEEELEELEKEYDEDGDDFEETYLEPIVKVKEEAIERTFDEFNEFFAAAAMMIEAKISFNQDDLGVFHCEAQGCVFSTLIRASIQQHVRQTHSAGGYQQPRFNCGKCGEAWANELYFKKHFESNECVIQQELPYVCENCGKGWYNLTNYTKHSEARECKTVVDMTNKHKCINCNLSFFSLRNRETHVRKAHMPPGETQYRCARCDINFVTHKEFNLHKKTIHANDGPKLRYNCRIPNCTFESGKKEDLAFHVKSNHPNSVHICTNCGRNFADNQKLLQHLASHARSGKGRKCMPANYNCPHCPREFNRKRHMELHVLFKHSQDRPFSCEQCGKKFKTRHCVNIHLRSHGIGGYSWWCEECGKTFNQISAYHVHLKVHSNVRDFACEDCGMTFKLKHSLKKHQLVHKTEFGHTCDFCGKKFKRSDNLINHRRRHTGEHPYKCDKCSWTGPDSSSFIHHKKKHAEPVHNVHQEVKHGVFTHLSQGHVQGVASQMIDQKPQINLQTIQEMKPIVHSNMGNIHQSQKPQINLQTVQEMKPIVHSSPSNMTTIHHPEIKLIHAITKIQHQGQHSPM